MEQLKLIFPCLILIVFNSCEAQKALMKSTESIDINRLLEINQKESVNKQKGSVSDTIRRVFTQPGRSDIINITEVVSSTGQTIVYKGNINDGLVKEEYNSNSPYVVIKAFYPSGQIRSSFQKYSEKHLSPAGYIEYPIGKIYTYDENGAVIKETDIGEIVKITFEDIKNLVEKLQPNSEITYADCIQTQHQEVLWKVRYMSAGHSLSEIHVNGKSGKIVFEIHNVQMRE